MREAYQSKIGQRILTTRLRVNLNPNFREARLLQQQLVPFLTYLISNRQNNDLLIEIIKVIEFFCLYNEMYNTGKNWCFICHVTLH